LLNKKKCSYKHRRLEEIETLSVSKPRAFWVYFRKRNQKPKECLSLNDFFTYFSNLENYIFTCRIEESDIFCENHDFNGSFNYVAFCFLCMYIFFFQCKGISKLLLRLSKLTYYNFFLFSFQPLSRVVYVVYVSVENFLLCTRLK